MMFFYSGADNFNMVQQDIDKSVGGFMSSTPIPNNMLENLFGSVSKLGIENQGVETKGIFLKNTLGVSVDNLFIYETYPDNKLCKLEIAVVSSPDGKSMEKIGNLRSSPYYATFHEPIGAGEQLLIAAPFAINAIVGIWLRRTVLPYDFPSCKEMAADADDEGGTYVPPPTVESPVVSLRWYSNLSITTLTLPAGTNGVPYDQAITLLNGNGTLTWSITTGSMPTGLVINSLTGEISGTPTTPGSYTFTVHVVDSIGLATSQLYTVVIS